jgi:hypothetical protein
MICDVSARYPVPCATGDYASTIREVAGSQDGGYWPPETKMSMQGHSWPAVETSQPVPPIGAMGPCTAGGTRSSRADI